MSTRTVSEIVEAVRQQGPADEQELRLALLCCFYDGHMAAPADFATAGELKLRMRAKENFERRFRMLRAVPATYLGNAFTPGTLENDQSLEFSRRLLDRVLKKKEGGK